MPNWFRIKKSIFPLIVDRMSVLPRNFRSPVAVICHDAGAANLIFAWLRNWVMLGLLDGHDFRLVLQGPAQIAWHEQAMALPNMQYHTAIDTALRGANCALTGTGWASTLEHDARNFAREQKIPCVAVIDHWVNYPQRFKRAGKVVLPDAIWVADPYALDIAGALFKNVSMVELPNVYLDELIKAIPPVSADCRTLLYVLEPMRTSWGRGTAGEFQALDFFIEHRHLIVGDMPVHISLRPHPSDLQGKYDSWIKSHEWLNVDLNTQPNLGKAIEYAKWVVGAETFAMVVASASGRETYSSLPPWGHRCQLPHKEILHLCDLIPKLIN